MPQIIKHFSSENEYYYSADKGHYRNDLLNVLHRSAELIETIE